MPRPTRVASNSSRSERAEAVIGSGLTQWRPFHYSTPPVAETLEIVLIRRALRQVAVHFMGAVFVRETGPLPHGRGSDRGFPGTF